MNTSPDLLACTLDGGRAAIEQRIADWQGLLSHATDRQPIDGGVALRFGDDPELAAGLARLAAAEYQCCGFFDFTLSINSDGLRLAVRAPAEAQEAVTDLFGAAS